ncbi:IclR family transcriptional regulator domain-containing protein [Arthrobacter globiformis]|uniref:IclR family transcriptional regulator domain-containing protein n=1 Tax=Arthrobacter globiformis TaxID=1665 RepID=UPI00277E248F|nr:IclR family transcriptional regulator C-terminal domain-containing protein [Arthrobacter globiformis]MDQ0867044.1 IclR family pca regulon transcriptional regulator [Arthrobacter globiformis]
MNASMPAAAELAATDPDYVESLDRGLCVLRAFSEHEEALSVTDVASLVGITRTAARRFALTLEYLGYASQSAEGYRLTPGVLEIGDAYLRSNPLPDAAHPHLDELVRAVGETASLTVLHKRRVYYAGRVAADRIVTANITVGTSVAAYKTATGRILLGDLTPDELEDYLSSIEPAPGFDPNYVRERIEEARRRGWTVADQELTPGIRSVAVPLHDPAGRIVAALNIAAHASRVDAQVLENDFVPLLQSAAQRTAAALWPAAGTAPTRPVLTPADANRPKMRPSDVIQSVERGLSILTAFDEGHPAMNLAQISERCGLPRSAARRFVLTLASLGYLAPQGRSYAPTPLVLELGYSLLSRLSLADVAKPRLEALARKLGASVSIGVLDGMDLRYVARASAPSPLTVNIRPGTRVPAERTAMGQVLLSLLPPAALEDAARSAGRDSTADGLADLQITLAAVREQGWGYVDQLLEAGIRAVAVPLRNRRGEVVAAMSASVHEASTPNRDMTENFLPALRNAAEEFVMDLRDGLDA